MKILYAASEAAPFIKSGGLGDVAHALPSRLSQFRHTEITVFLPYYQSIKDNPDINVEFLGSINVPLAWRNAYAGIFRVVSARKKLKYYFIDNESYFKRAGTYGYYDDGERYAFFSKAVLEALQFLDYYPDVIHCNDWQTSLIPVFLHAHYQQLEKYRRIKTVFTIHNIEYQGKAPMEFANDVLGLDQHWTQIVTYDKCINLMKGAIETADMITTVSKTYSEEIRYAYYSHGLHPILQRNEHKLCGITNGIDMSIFNPATDKTIVANYSSDDISNKSVCKSALQKELGLWKDPSAPLISIVSRLVDHKGLDLVKSILEELLSWGVQMAVLGTGDSMYEQFFRECAERHHGQLSVNICFDSKLANRIYSASDMFLMPSKSEPCGLSQMIAMRYGTVPIVRETGGLKDTVPALNPETMEGAGFTFKSYNAQDMLDAIRRCISFYRDTPKWNTHIAKLIDTDSSWAIPAQQYMDIYNKLCGHSDINLKS